MKTVMVQIEDENYEKIKNEQGSAAEAIRNGKVVSESSKPRVCEILNALFPRLATKPLREGERFVKFTLDGYVGLSVEDKFWNAEIDL